MVKQQFVDIFGKQIKFNKDFDKILNKLKEGMIKELVDWCKRCKVGDELGSVPPKKQHKVYYVFFRKIASDVRVTLIKLQNGEFIEIRLENHKEYDHTRLKLGYKKSSYYLSTIF